MKVIDAKKDIMKSASNVHDPLPREEIWLRLR